ncbi:MAG: UDP-N-acetylglucosamine 2-epimerase (non-hydrolyzing) [Rhodothermales bacterium]
MRIVTIIGARPQFVKAAAVSRELVEAGVHESLVHTGQHYDPEMSAIFFDELGIPEPEVNLGVGSASHAVQTGEMMIALEAYLMDGTPPDWVMVYGDTNSTLAGALVASKLHLPLAHVEAGLRSFNRRMPEEINRIVTDRLSSLLFCPTRSSVENLRAEGVTEGVHLTGDVMLDATRLFGDLAERRSSAGAPAGASAGPAAGEYYAATVHRAENTDDPNRLAGIFEGFGRLDLPVVLPLHPRTRSRLADIHLPGNVEVVEPLGYLDMLELVRHARAVLTDSGGLQKEALWLGVPCVTLRDETEWIETLKGGWNQVVGADPGRIAEAVRTRPDPPVPTFAEPGASRRIVDLLLETPTA